MKTFNTIDQRVSQVFDIPVSAMRSKSRAKEVLFARYAAMYISRKMTYRTLKTIGNHYGGRTHDTVISALNTVENLIEQNWVFTHNLCKAWYNVEQNNHD